MMTVIYCDMRIIYLAEFTDFAEYSAGYFDDQDNDYNYGDADWSSLLRKVFGVRMCILVFNLHLAG